MVGGLGAKVWYLEFPVSEGGGVRNHEGGSENRKPKQEPKQKSKVHVIHKGHPSRSCSPKPMHLNCKRLNTKLSPRCL